MKPFLIVMAMRKEAKPLISLLNFSLLPAVFGSENGFGFRAEGLFASQRH